MVADWSILEIGSQIFKCLLTNAFAKCTLSTVVGFHARKVSEMYREAGLCGLNPSWAIKIFQTMSYLKLT